MTKELLEIYPPDQLKFTFELRKESSCTNQVTNGSEQYVAFKIKTTSFKDYTVRPNMGILKPRETCDITFTMRSLKKALPDLQSKDMFLFQSTVVPSETTKDDITSEMFREHSGKYIEVKKLRVVLVSLPHTPVVSTELLEIYPPELKFTFELRKQSSCITQLINRSDQYVAFKIFTTSPKSHCVRPNRGILKPKETCDVKFTMQSLNKAPPDLQSKDKFMFQSMIVPFETTEEDITSDMFSKHGGKYIEQKKLRVVLISAESRNDEVDRNANIPPPICDASDVKLANNNTDMGELKSASGIAEAKLVEEEPEGSESKPQVKDSLLREVSGLMTKPILRILCLLPKSSTTSEPPHPESLTVPLLYGEASEDKQDSFSQPPTEKI